MLKEIKIYKIKLILSPIMATTSFGATLYFISREKDDKVHKITNITHRFL